MGIDLEAGDHEISMTYTPAGLWPGAILSGVCVVLFILTCILEAKNRKEAEKKMRLEFLRRPIRFRTVSLPD